MIRSGSTLQYQLAGEILATRGPVRKLGFIPPEGNLPAGLANNPGPGLCKLHHFDQTLAGMLKHDKAVGVYSFRDLRDVAVSVMRQFKISFDQAWGDRWLHYAVEAGEKWLALPNVYSAKYEVYSKNLEQETERISQYLGIHITPQQITSITNENRLEALKAKAEYNAAIMGSTGKPIGNEGDVKNPWMPNDGSIGRWKDVLTPGQQELIEGEFADWLELRGYTTYRAKVSATSPKPVEVKAQTNEVFAPHLGWFAHAPNDEVARLLLEGHYEADLQAFFFLYLRAGDRVIDVGSHFGLYSRLASQRVGAEGRVLALEPHPVTQGFLSQNLQPAKQATLIKAALGGATGEAELVIGETGYSAHSYLAENAAERTATVEVKTLHQLLADAAWQKADLVKIDTEGREFDVLEGAGDLLGTAALPVVTLEFAEKNLLQFGRTTRQLARFLRQSGYQVCRLAPESMLLSPVGDDIWPVWYENFIAVLDLDSVNDRLRAATAESQRVARDILARAVACQPIKEISELETYRHQAAQSLQYKAWAEKTERLLSAERALSAEFKQWAERAEFELADEKIKCRDFEEWATNSETHLAREKQRAIDFEKWALQTEELLTLEKERAAEFENWARKNEEALKNTKSLASSNEAWALKTEQELVTAKALAATNEKWALKTERLLAMEKERAEEFEKWALKTEAALHEANSLAAAHQLWAEKTERMLADSRKESADNFAWAQRTEQFLAEARAALTAHQPS